MRATISLPLIPFSFFCETIVVRQNTQKIQYIARKHPRGRHPAPQMEAIETTSQCRSRSTGSFRELLLRIEHYRGWDGRCQTGLFRGEAPVHPFPGFYFGRLHRWTAPKRRALSGKEPFEPILKRERGGEPHCTGTSCVKRRPHRLYPAIS